jgi:hypothetical protein
MEISFSAEDLKQMAEIAPKGAAAGLRYPETAMQYLNV